MCRGEVIHLAPYGANRADIAAIKPDTFIQYQVAYRVVLHVVVIFLNQECRIVIQYLFSEGAFHKCTTYLLEFLTTLMFGRSRFCFGVYFVVRSSENLVAQFRDRKSVVSGRSVSVRVDLGGGRIIKKK